MIEIIEGLTNVLDVTPVDYRIDGSLVDDWESDDVTVIIKGGDKFTVKSSEDYRSEYAHVSNHSYKGETVAECIARNNIDEGKIIRVEWRNRGVENTQGRDYAEWDSTTWYIPDNADLLHLAKQAAIVDAAEKLASKKMGFGEFKKVLKEYS